VNQAESNIHQVESKMDEFKDQLPADEVCLLHLYFESNWLLIQIKKNTFSDLTFLLNCIVRIHISTLIAMNILNEFVRLNIWSLPGQANR
jgi:hypothetical protein